MDASSKTFDNAKTKRSLIPVVEVTLFKGSIYQRLDGVIVDYFKSSRKLLLTLIKMKKHMHFGPFAERNVYYQIVFSKYY